MARVLCAEDDAASLEYLRTLLASAGHDVVMAHDGVEALAAARDDGIELVITDILMPRMDGYRLSMEFRQDPHLSGIPFIFYTASYTDPEDEELANRLGASRFVRKPMEPSALLAVVEEVLTGVEPSAAPPSSQSPRDVEAERDLLSDYSDRLVRKLQQKVDQLTRTLDGIIGAMVRVVEIRDPYTAGHQVRVAHIARAIGHRLDMSEDELSAIDVAGRLHDIGKLAVPAEILSKPGELTAAEFEIIKSHPVVTHDILSGIDFPWPVATIALQHHERLDGSGYPHGLTADAILPEARVLAVADVVEAMSSHRPYRPARGTAAALEEVMLQSDSRLDPEVARTCCDLFDEGVITLDQGPGSAL